MSSFINLLHEKEFHSLILLLPQNQKSRGRLNLYIILVWRSTHFTLSTEYRKSYSLSLPFVLVPESNFPKVISWELSLSSSSSCVAEDKQKLLVSNVHVKKKVESLSFHVVRLCASSSEEYGASSCGIMQFFGHLHKMCLLGFLFWDWITTVSLVSVIIFVFSLFHCAFCTMQHYSECCDLLPCAIFSFAVTHTADVLPQSHSAVFCV